MSSSQQNTASRFLRTTSRVLLPLGIVLVVVFSIPTLYIWSAQHTQLQPFSNIADQFPITVDPLHKVIVENEKVNAFLASPNSPLAASVDNVKNVAWNLFGWVAQIISDIPLYQSLAVVNERVVNVTPGLRKEQVASVFGKSLAWSGLDQKNFITPGPKSELPLVEGSYLPGLYVVSVGTTAQAAQALVNQRFTEEVLSHYGSQISQVVPLNQALTIASIIQRETLGTEDMRLVSGIIWNRLFAHMNLQVDSTLQYAKSTGRPSPSWWPQVTPADKYIKSPYNTYVHEGLPPTPIANPSVAALLAALNPIKTSCLFYFNDPKGNIICSNTYREHVGQLKKYYGQGK